MSPDALFVTGLGTGLIAGGASCAAVQGGLLAGAVTRLGPLVARRAAHAPGAHARPRERSVVAPVAVFLTGKLVSHTMLGAGLGAFGRVLQPTPAVRAVLLLVAATVMALFAFELIGVPLARRLAPRTPVSWFALLRRGSRTGWALAPALLGVGTVLVPCGVTLSIALVAITTGSPLGGAAVMAGFVAGTAPLFTILGYLLRTATRAWQGRLRVVTGIVVLMIAGWTAFSGLRLGGWLAAAAPEAAPEAAPAARTPEITMGGRQTITVTVHDEGYRPGAVTARAGTPIVLMLRTRESTGCTRTFVIPSLGLEKVLPKTANTRVELGPRRPGTLRYTCGMGMYGGAIRVTR